MGETDESPVGLGQAVSTDEGHQLVDKVKQQSSPDGKIALNTDPKNLNWTGASAYDVEGTLVVTVPLKNEGTQWSNLTVALNQDQEIENYTEAHFYELSDTSGRVTVYQDGELTTDRVSEAKEEPVRVTTFGLRDAVGELNSCLSAAGIPAWVVAGATAACSAFGGWAGLLACYTASGVAGGTVGYCAGKAAKKL